MPPNPPLKLTAADLLLYESDQAPGVPMEDVREALGLTYRARSTA